MVLSAFTMIFLIVSSGFWVIEARNYNSTITVPNGGKWGQWGTPEFCPKGYAIGFNIKKEPCGTAEDATGLNAIALMCDDGKTITSSVGPWGNWQDVQFCPHGKLKGFTLNVLEEIDGDNTAANNIIFFCNDRATLVGNGMQGGAYSLLLSRCRKGTKICGIQTKLQSPQYTNDDTALNDVKMFCCN